MGLTWSKEKISPPRLHVDDEKVIPRTDTHLPQPVGDSRSYWLQNVSADPLLDHRTTEELPSHADVVIIGSGVGSLMVLPSKTRNNTIT